MVRSVSACASVSASVSSVPPDTHTHHTTRCSRGLRTHTNTCTRQTRRYVVRSSCTACSCGARNQCFHTLAMHSRATSAAAVAALLHNKHTTCTPFTRKQFYHTIYARNIIDGGCEYALFRCCLCRYFCVCVCVCSVWLLLWSVCRRLSGPAMQYNT